MKKSKSKAAPKAAKQPVKRIEIYKWGPDSYDWKTGGKSSPFAHPRAFVAIRAAYRYFKAQTAQGVPYNKVSNPSGFTWYTPKGQRIDIVRKYLKK